MVAKLSTKNQKKAATYAVTMLQSRCTAHRIHNTCTHARGGRPAQYYTYTHRKRFQYGGVLVFVQDVEFYSPLSCSIACITYMMNHRTLAGAFLTNVRTNWAKTIWVRSVKGFLTDRCTKGDFFFFSGRHKRIFSSFPADIKGYFVLFRPTYRRFFLFRPT